MDSTAVLRSFHYTLGSSSYLKTVLDKPKMLTMSNAASFYVNNFYVCGKKASTSRQRPFLVSCVKKTSDATLLAKSNGNANGAMPSDSQQLLAEKKYSRATFPNGFEALVTEVCDETKIAELKLKFGTFEVHMKRSLDGPTIPEPIVLQAAAPPEKASASSPPKSSSEKASAFTNVSIEKAAILAKLEASGSGGYALVSSPAVGSFRRSRTLKGKKQPPACKEGDVIKEGQIIGYLDRFGGELPVKSDVAGKVLKLLYEDGEAVGYGDPIIAVLPSL